MVGCAELATCELMMFLVVFWPVKEVYILAEVGMGILEVVYKGLILVASKLVEELLQTMLVVSQLCVVWVVSQCCVLKTTVVAIVAGVHMVGLISPMTGKGVVMWVVSQYGTLVVTVVIVVVVSGAHVLGLTALQSSLSVQVNLALCWLCSICTSGSKLVSQFLIAAEHCPMIMSSHVSLTRQFIPVSDIGLKINANNTMLHYITQHNQLHLLWQMTMAPSNTTTASSSCWQVGGLITSYTEQLNWTSQQLCCVVYRLWLRGGYHNINCTFTVYL